ncbi:hypothetical protein FRC02_012375 [Tulasnella sp. 418]|nr:hypothetical protein FRC02_012375 [Tulasnella sp. 418]
MRVAIGDLYRRESVRDYESEVPRAETLLKQFGVLYGSFSYPPSGAAIFEQTEMTFIIRNEATTIYDTVGYRTIISENGDPWKYKPVQDKMGKKLLFFHQLGIDYVRGLLWYKKYYQTRLHDERDWHITDLTFVNTYPNGHKVPFRAESAAWYEPSQADKKSDMQDDYDGLVSALDFTHVTKESSYESIFDEGVKTVDRDLGIALNIRSFGHNSVEDLVKEI